MISCLPGMKLRMALKEALYPTEAGHEGRSNKISMVLLQDLISKATKRFTPYRDFIFFQKLNIPTSI